MRKHWHQACADIWVRMNNPVKMRKYVIVRDKFKCQECGYQGILLSEFEADHIKPLFEAHGDLSYYDSDNVETKCKPCHKKKTKADMELWRAAYS